MVNLVDPEVVPEQFHKHSELISDENTPIISMMSRESVDAYCGPVEAYSGNVDTYSGPEDTFEHDTAAIS